MSNVRLGFLVAFVPTLLLGQAPDQVRVTRSYDEVKDCQFVSELHTWVTTRVSFAPNRLYDNLRQSAARRGADVVVLLSDPVTHGSKMELSGSAYRCGARAGSDPGMRAPVVERASEEPAVESPESARRQPSEQTLGPPPSAYLETCRSSFVAKGSAIRGSTFSAALTFSDEACSESLQRIAAALPAFGFASTGLDSGGASLLGISRNEKGDTYPLDVRGSESQAGCHIEARIALPILMRSDDDEFETRLCSLLVTGAAPPAGQSEQEPRAGHRDEATGSIEERLERLLQLKQKGLISEEEYQTRKREILNEI